MTKPLRWALRTFLILLFGCIIAGWYVTLFTVIAVPYGPVLNYGEFVLYGSWLAGALLGFVVSITPFAVLLFGLSDTDEWIV